MPGDRHRADRPCIPIYSNFGGVLIGIASSLLLLINGRTAGISGIAGGLLARVAGERSWRLAFLGGLVAGGFLLRTMAPEAFGESAAPSAALLVVAGLLVGFGTRLGSGCTSGYGICGIARGARRSIAATLTFMVTGAATVFIVNHLIGSGS